MTARRLQPDDLILSQHSLRDVDFDVRVGAAAAAGFAAIGLAAGEYTRLRDEGWSDARLVKALDRNALVVDEIEALRLDGSRVNEDVLWHMADLFGSTHAHVLGPHPGDLARAVAELRRVVDAATTHGVTIAIEFFPPTNIPDLASAVELVCASERACGICVDTWHHFRGTCDWEGLRALPSNDVVSVQLSDGPIVPVEADYFADTIAHRLAPGDGAFDLIRFVRTLDAAGVAVPWSVEVMSAAPVPDVDALVQHLADGTRALLAAARQHGVG